MSCSFRLGLPNTWPAGHIWPAKLFCVAREAVLRGPRGLFARLISSWKGLLSILWQIKRSKPKPSFVWYSQNQFGFAAKTFFFRLHLLFGADSCNTDGNQLRFAAKTFFFVFTFFLRQIPVILAKVSTDFVKQTCNYLVYSWQNAVAAARDSFSPVNVARTSKKVGQPCFTCYLQFYF